MLVTGRVERGYKRSLEHEQIRGTGWDEKHDPTDRSSSHTHQGRTASPPDAAGTARGIQTSLMKSQKPPRLTLAFPVSHRQHRETPPPVCPYSLSPARLPPRGQVVQRPELLSGP